MAAIIPIPAFSDNYIWLVREGRNAAVVDPGDAAPVLAYLDREGLTLTAIVNTHHHGDHASRQAPKPELLVMGGHEGGGQGQAVADQAGHDGMR